MDIVIVFFISVIYRYDEVEPKALLDSGPFKYLFYFIKNCFSFPSLRQIHLFKIENESYNIQ